MDAQSVQAVKTIGRLQQIACDNDITLSEVRYLSESAASDMLHYVSFIIQLAAVTGVLSLARIITKKNV